MAELENEQERPCLHCLMVDLIDDFFAEYPPARRVRQGRYGRSGRNYRSRREDRGRIDLSPRRHFSPVSDGLMREIMKFDGEFRREDAAGSVAPKYDTDC